MKCTSRRRLVQHGSTVGPYGFGFLSMLVALAVLPCLEVAAWGIPATSRLPNIRISKSNEDVVTIDTARFPQDLPAIQSCRATVDFAQNPPERLLKSQVSFLEASALQKSSTNSSSKAVNQQPRCIVARRGSEVLATAECHFKSNCILVNNIYVKPTERGRGLGRRLMTEGIEQLVAEPSQMDTCLNVYTGNTAAIRLYESCGYQADGPAHAMIQSMATMTGSNLMISMRKPYPVSRESTSLSFPGRVRSMLVNRINLGFLSRKRVAHSLNFLASLMKS